ncbi:putative hydrolase of the HAD superfamily [Paenibacillus uliginis N3/975]|uniref:Phosphoserine phosphatase n=1 Tax=Paenibacillus uliginis N3/975 TaxID=1313296 RepID=A0A1X7HGW4_9BACL|nr:HAD family hydrolase [Paenibacillus uliginis]SMF86432.1 putative hydrolase of the HAD superfamily [Paenibacillus uliginis N3/975]
MPATAVLFDLDDTLLWDERSVEEAFEVTCQAGAESTGIDATALLTAVRSEARSLYESYDTFAFTKLIGINPFEGLWANFTAGDQPEFRRLQELAPVYRKESWRRGLKSLGVENDELAEELAERFAAERRKRPYVYDETFDVLKELQNTVKLLLLTNGSPDLQQEKLDGVPELATYFNHIVISGDFGKGKPDASIFTHALGLLGVEPENAVMVGDKLTTDIKGGNAAGLTTVWINRTDRPKDSSIVPDYEIQSLSELHDILSSL